MARFLEEQVRYQEFSGTEMRFGTSRGQVVQFLWCQNF